MDIDLGTLQARWTAQDARLNDVLRVNRRLVGTIEQGRPGRRSIDSGGHCGSRSPSMRAGASLNDARDQLAALAAFEREDE